MIDQPVEVCRFRAVLLLVLLLPLVSPAQQTRSLTLAEVQVMSRDNYPLSRQRDLIRKTGDYTVANALKAYLPQLTVQGQATHQSDVTNIPVHLPGVDIPSVNKTQYRLYGELSQAIYDGGLAKQKAAEQRVQAAVEERQLETELYQLKERVNQIFFGIILIDEQLAQTSLVKKDIALGMEKMEAAIDNGTAIRSSLDLLKAEMLRTEQRVTELQSNRKAYLDMLGLYLNEQLSDSVMLVKPPPVLLSADIRRPELLVFEQQKRKLDIREKIINIRNRPRLSAFLQAGFGNPSPVNLLKDQLKGYYIAGIRLSWSLSGLYTSRNDQALIDIGRKTLDVQRDNFLFNTGLLQRRQETEIGRWQQLMKTDKEIVALRLAIKNTAYIQLENGLISSSDYLREVNAEDQARQNLIIHQVQMLLAQYQYQTITGYQ